MRRGLISGSWSLIGCPPAVLYSSSPDAKPPKREPAMAGLTGAAPRRIGAAGFRLAAFALAGAGRRGACLPILATAFLAEPGLAAFAPRVAGFRAGAVGRFAGFLPDFLLVAFAMVSQASSRFASFQFPAGTVTPSSRRRSGVAPRTRTRLSFAVAPATISTCSGRMRRASARSRRSASFARPRSGGAATRTLSFTPYRPTTSSRRAPGATRTSNSIA